MIKAVTRRGKVWRSEAGLGRARHGLAWMGEAGLGMAGKAGHGNLNNGETNDI